MIVLFSKKRWVGGNFLKTIFYGRTGMKNESMKQLNAWKSCLFSPGAIQSEQVMSVVKYVHQ